MPNEIVSKERTGGCWGIENSEVAELQTKYPDYEVLFYANPRPYGCNYVALYKDGKLYIEDTESFGREKRTSLKQIIKLKDNVAESAHTRFNMSYDAIRWFKRELKTRHSKEVR